MRWSNAWSLPPGTPSLTSACPSLTHPPVQGEPPLAELIHEGEKALLLVGGRGGRGNTVFKTARNNAPTLAERGEKGPEAWVELELRVVADCGIIGVPNAGKSTLLR